MTNIFVSLCRKLEGTYITRYRPVGYVYTKIFYLLKPSKVSLEPVGEHKMYLDLADTTSMRMFMFKLDRPMISFLEKTLKPGSVFIDIGAHVGYFTLRAAKLVGGKGHVYAFEPEPKNHGLLCKNVEINNYKNVLIVDKCISNKNGFISFFVAKDSGTHSTKMKSKNVLRLKATTLDQFCKDNKISKIDLIKIDVEGGETDAFEGMKNIVKRNKNVKLIAEFVPSYVKNSGNTPKIFMNKLLSMGFKKFYLITENEILPSSPAEIESLREDIYNVLAEK